MIHPIFKPMPDAFYFSQLNSFFEHWLEPYRSAALMTIDHQPLYIKYLNLPDIGTLTHTGEMISKYLSIEAGDIILVNDPYSGGTTLSTMTLVMGISLDPRRMEKKSGGSPDFLLCSRFQLKPSVSLSPSIEEEGVRIPPTPLRHKGQFNESILKVIAEHPLCPKGFVEATQEMIITMDQTWKQILRDSREAQLDWSKPRLKQLIKESSRLFSERVERIAFGEATNETLLDSGEKLRLNLAVTDGKVKFDFSGTSSSEFIHLTDSATYGVCVGTLLSVLESQFPLNGGIFSCFEVRAPQGSLVNSKYPAPVYQGMTDGVGLLANFILQVLSQIDPSHKMAQSGTSLCSFELEFTQGLKFFDTLEPGMAASSQGKGYDAINPWQKSYLEPSIEEIERRYPLLVKSYTIRQKSGGSGGFEGGNGTTKAIQLLSPSHLKWFITSASQKPEGGEGGKAASSSEIYLQKAQTKNREKLPARGTITLQPGDTIIMHSSGGGGFGS